MSEQISDKNKKSEILDAYNKLLTELQAKSNQQQKLPVLDEQKQQQDEVLKKTNGYNIESIQQQINDFQNTIKNKLQSVIDSLNNELLNTGKKLTEELSKLKDIKEAKSIEENKLKELYGIKNTAVSLSEFLNIIKETKENWEKEKQIRNNAWSEENQEKEIKRKRENDEYQYQLKIKRQQDEDTYNVKKQQEKDAFEKEIKERREEITKKEKEIKEQLHELESLKKFKSEYEKTLESAVKKALEQQTSELKKDLDIKLKLETQKYQAEKDLLNQKILSLEEALKDKNLQINELKKEATEAKHKSQELALKVIESGNKDIKLISTTGDKTGDKAQ